MPDKPDYKFCPWCGLSLEVMLEEGQERKHCRYCRWINYPSVDLVSVGIVIRGGRVALVKRNREHKKGTWNFAGGFVNYKEHPDDAVRREIEEELGLTAISAEFIKFVPVDNGPNRPGQLLFFYLIEATGELLNNDTAENSEIDWFDIATPPPLGFPTHQEMMEWLQERFHQTSEVQL